MHACVCICAYISIYSIYPLVLKHLPISSTAPSPNGILLVFSARGVLLADENSGASVVEWFGSIGRSMQTLFTIQTLAGWDSRTTMAGWMSEGVVSWGLPSGKRLHSELENHHFQWKIQL